MKDYSKFDHSLTYQGRSLRNLFHKKRLDITLGLIEKHIGKVKNLDSYGDFGASNGYITDIISKKLRINKTVALDNCEEHLLVGKKRYKNIKFKNFDLDIPHNKTAKFDLITCFSTLEHVGNLENALVNILKSGKSNSLIVLSVPIETGYHGITKFLFKSIFYPRVYKTNELKIGKFRYLVSLIKNDDTSILREKGLRSSTHFGFNEKKIDQFLIEKKLNLNLFQDFSRDTI